MKKFMLKTITISTLGTTLLLSNSCPEVNILTNPNGVKNQSFNCYTDNNKTLGKRYGGDTKEQNFIRVAKKGFLWGNTISSTEKGDKIAVLFYMHNSAKEGTAKDVNMTLKWIDGNITGTISSNNTIPSSVSDTATVNLNSGDRLVYKGAKVSNKFYKNGTPNGTHTTFPFAKFDAGYSNAQEQLVFFEVQ
jgi:hypothetical protein